MTGKVFFAVLSLALAASVLAAETPSQGASEAAAPSFWSRVGLSVGAETYGPSLTEWDARRPDINKGTADNPKDLVRTKLKFTPSYKTGESTATVLGIESEVAATRGLYLRDPYLAFRDSKLVAENVVRTDAQVRAYLPMSTSSQTARQIGAVRLVQDTKWDLPASRVQLEFYSYYHRSIFSADADPKASAGELWVEPGVNFRAAATLWLQLHLKSSSKQVAGDSLLAFKTDPALLTIGVSWDVVPGVNVSPYLDASPKQNLSPDFTTLGMNLSWRMI